MTARKRPKTQELISVAQAAEIIGLDESQVRRHCASGRLRANRLGGRTWMIFEDDAKKFAGEVRKPGPKPRKKIGK